MIMIFLPEPFEYPVDQYPAEVHINKSKDRKPRKENTRNTMQLKEEKEYDQEIKDCY